MPLLSTGNIQLDYLIGGGVEKNKSVILVGEPGSGKTTVALNFISDQNFYDSRAAYVCIDKKPEKIMNYAVSINSLMQQKISDGLLSFVEISIQEWTIEQPLNELLLIIQLQLDALFHNYKIERLVIDSLLPHILFGFPKEKKQYFIRELLNIISALNTTSMCILYDITSYQFLWLDTDLVSDQLVFNKKFEWGYSTYSLEVSKNSKKNSDGRYRFIFDDKKGIAIKHRVC